jgi:hypothetical protein
MIRQIVASPMGWLITFCAVVVALLMMPLRLPIGPNYWDLFTYVDTAYRIKLGQLPNVDFFVPVGPIGYFLYMVVAGIFSQAHTLLAVHYSILIIALPLMAVIAWQSSQHSRTEALALVIPFILFGALPINVIELYPSPGFDAFGNYNRHVALLLYVLACNLLFVGNRAIAAVIAVVIVVALFLTKITACLIAIILVIQAIITSRVSLRWTIASLVGFAFILLAMELRTTLISHYVHDIIELVGLNTGFLLPRILTVLSQKLNVILPTALLVAIVVWTDRAAISEMLKGIFSGRFISAFQLLTDHNFMWLLALLIGGLVFETQNTGSHEFILLWPAIVLVMRHYPLPWNRKALPALVFIAAVVLPTPITVIHRTLRAVLSAAKYQPIEAPLLGPMGRLSAKPEIMLQSRAMLSHYADSRASFERMAKRNVLPSYILFSEIDFQISWVISTQQAAEAILQYEMEKKVRLEKVVTLDFVDPIPFMLGRTPLRDLSIGNDPDRTLAKLGAHVIAEINSADAILVPLCPVTNARNLIFSAYAKDLSNRRIVALTPCFNMLVKN